MSPTPRVAVVLPAYRSHATIVRCLEALEAQSFRDFETIVVDSSPGDETETLVTARFPFVTYWHSPTRLFPHAARNAGVRRASAPILVSTDPDVYARPDWLERLVAAHDETGEAIVGALDCYGRRWLDRGIHICKFSKWLPGGARREVDMGPTAALLVRRSDYDAAGGFERDLFLGDVEFSYALRARGRGLFLEPGAVVEHHHTQTLGGFLRERWSRGILYARLQTAHRDNDRLELLGWLLVTALPVRLARNLALVASQCRSAGRVAELIVSAPVVALGYAASLGGEAFGYSRLLVAKPRRTT
ncbi:MAG: glycosyltransferase [Thermoanaerobaculia bacterium]